MSRQAEHLMLLDWARLTDEEIGDVSESCWDADHPERCDYGSTITGHLVRCVADAQLEKAMRTIATWIRATMASEAAFTPEALPLMRLLNECRERLARSLEQEVEHGAD